MNDTFNIGRFGKYFAFDLRQMWHNNGKASLMLGLCGLILYVAVVTVSLVFSFHWQGPGIGPRAVVFFVALFALVFYEARIYGHLTDKAQGSSYLMVPASVLEKTISMILIGVVVLPLALSAVYLSVDAVLSLVDPTVGEPLVGSIGTVTSMLSEQISQASAEADLPLKALWIPAIIGTISSLLYFLLSGIIFKKWKILGGIGVMLLVEFLLTNVMALILKGNTDWLANWAIDLTSREAFNAFIVWGSIASALWCMALAACIYLRIKTIKH